MKLHTKIVTVISLVIAVCAWGFVIYEAQSVISQFAEVNNYRRQIVTDETIAMSTDSAKKTFLGIGDDSHILDQYFVSATDTPVFIENIETLARSLNLSASVGSVDIVPSNAANGASNLAMTLSVSGSWNDMLHFVHLLELMPYAVSIGQVNFQISDLGQQTGQQGGTSGKAPVTGWRADIDLSVASQ